MNIFKKINAKHINDAIRNSDMTDAEKLDAYDKMFTEMINRLESDTSINPHKKEKAITQLECGLAEVAAQSRNLPEQPVYED